MEENKNLENRSFEEAMERLEQIVRTMERGEVSLEESMRLFEEGTTLVRLCGEMLDTAQMRVTQVTPGATGEPLETEFKYDE